MGESRPIVAANYYFGHEELGNRIFAPTHSSPTGPIMRAFRDFMAERGVDVVTLDTVDFNDPAVKYVLYFDYNWRCVRTDPFLAHIPRQKRALIMIEPANINPSMYYISFLRDRFHTVFTWDLNLIRKNPSYSQINVPVGAEPRKYRENPFGNISFTDKRFLVAVSRNRWSYMPQSTYSVRKRAYSHFEKTFPSDFDLFGQGWNAPNVFYEQWCGWPRFMSYRGAIEGGSDEKVRVMSDYKFALCFENNASQPGYISEKIMDCFCARCVPVYYGSKGTEEMIPSDAWINLRDFRNLDELRVFLNSMDEVLYNRYIAAIDRFMQSDRIGYFSNSHLFGAIAGRLGFPLINYHGMGRNAL